MADVWQTLEEAALTLGVSSRTLHRRIARNEFQTRMNAGRREILVSLPDPVVPEADVTLVDEHEPVSRAADNHHASTDTMLALHEDRLRRTDMVVMAYQQSMVQVAEQVRRSRAHVRIAWASVAVVALMLFAGGLWSVNRLSQAQTHVGHLSDELERTRLELRSIHSLSEDLRLQAESARLAAARAEGELHGIRAASATIHSTNEPSPPATQPTRLLDRLTQLFQE
jgi:hypothetical protein